MTEDDSEAISRLKRGDVGGLRTLVEHYQDRAVRAAYLITLDTTAAEDIVQDAFLRAYERIAQFDAKRAFGPWFLRSVVNDAIKLASRNQTLPLDDPISELPDLTGSDPANLVEIGETREAIWAVLNQLPAAQRGAIVQHYYLDLTEVEIARELNTPLGTIKWRLHAARQQLGILLNWTKP